jgi:uncharacterized protein
VNIFYLCIGLLALLSLLLGILVTVGRGKFDTFIGHSSDPEDTLHKWVRAHSNTTEYAPLLMILIYLLSLNPISSWVWWFIILATGSRYVFVAGILFPKTMAKPNPMRFIGATGTYLFGVGLCVALFQQALNA